MNLHGQAKSCPFSRALFVEQVLSEMTVIQASEMAGFSERTGHKWLKRFREEEKPGLRDRSSQPRQLARSHELGLVVEAVGRLHVRESMANGSCQIHLGLLALEGRDFAALCSASKRTAEPIWARSPRRLAAPRHEKLARSHEVGHRATGIRHGKNRKAGYQVLPVCNDDHSRACYMEVLPDEKKGTEVAFLLRALLHAQAQGVPVRKLLTDNDSPNHSKEFKAMREAFGLKHARTQPCRPGTNGKAERLIQTALRDWAYGSTWQSSDGRSQAVSAWLHSYNHHRPHSAIGGQPRH
ncbi:integrase core domain-containing protein [Geothrix sp. PMB-07]|uniref:integrase core domain-containing protein n=1 Tax=Geothrix sp. PMB-07 TaxID=3068640 RepID=UPI0027408907|nr:leucine zipper domain-containing protein [Geothrix sp. PMB-07]WLT31933.1 leucine zipper domain-containing protein [Geothrix sp. PMB-07]